MRNVEIGYLLIPEDLVHLILNNREKYNLEDIIDRKVFRVNSTSLSYRQINTLDRDGLLPEARDLDSKWRSFSMRDLLYLEIVSELKKYGMDHAQLKNVWDIFFNTDRPGYKQWVSTVGIIATMMGENISFIITHDGVISFANRNELMLSEMTVHFPASTLRIPLVNRLNRILELANKKSIVIQNDLMTWREHQILEIINNSDYERISITRLNGEKLKIRASEYKKTDPIVRDVYKSIMERKYADVEIIHRNGRTVASRVTDTFKID